MLRRNCRRLGTVAKLGGPKDSKGAVPLGYLRNVKIQNVESAVASACLDCPLLAASRGSCPLRATCPVYNQQPYRPFTASSKMGAVKGGECEYCQRALGAQVKDTLRCPHCERLISPEKNHLNYFDLLQEGRVSFEVDHSLLRKKFLDLQRRMHPDHFAQLAKSDEEGWEESQTAATWSAVINRAHETLRSDLSRAIYLYNLLLPFEPYDEECSGMSMAEEDLMEFLELRETIEDSGALTEIQQVMGYLEEMLRLTKVRLSKGFQRVEENREALKGGMDRLKFLETIMDAAEARYHQFSP